MQDSLLQLFSLGTIALLAASLLWMLLAMLRVHNPLAGFLARYRMQAVFFFSLVASVGSLTLSLYFLLPPCELCWYQRIFLFPIPLVSFVAAVRQDARARAYVFVLAAAGFAIALYHSLMQAGIVKGAPAFCNPSAAIDCAVPQFVHYGFVTIPVMSLAVFLALLVMSYARNQD